MSTLAALSLAVAFARFDLDRTLPEPGDLVVEVSGGDTDPDAIGWLLRYGPAPYHDDDPVDGSVPMRDVWDILPLAGLSTEQERRRGFQRWENATFRKVPEEIAEGLPAGKPLAP